MLEVGAHHEIVRIHAADFPVQCAGERIAECAGGFQFGSFLDGGEQLDATLEEAGAEGFTATALDAVGVLAEEVEIEAEVEDAEVLLVLIRAEEVFAKAGATAYHLPELDLGVNRLEEDQVGDLRHVDAGIQHVHGNGDVRGFVLFGKVVEDALWVFCVVVDDACEVSCVMRVVEIETLLDEYRVVVIAGEDDGLAESVASFDLEAFFHQVLEHFVYRVGIEQPTVDCGGLHGVRCADVAVVVSPVERFPFGFLRIAEIIVADAVAGEFEIHLPDLRRHKKAIADCQIELVGIGGHAFFEVKQFVGILIHLFARGGGEADEQAVEVAENFAVALIDRAVRFIDDD